jgi:hypothetical protein
MSTDIKHDWQALIDDDEKEVKKRKKKIKR